MTDDVRLDSPESAYAYSGLDKDFCLFKYYTVPVYDKVEGCNGVFEADFRQPIIALEREPDPVGYLRLAATLCIQKAVKTSGIPIEAWIVEFSPVMARYQIPSHLYLNRARDRRFLETGEL